MFLTKLKYEFFLHSRLHAVRRQRGERPANDVVGQRPSRRLPTAERVAQRRRQDRGQVPRPHQTRSQQAGPGNHSPHGRGFRIGNFVT